MTMYILKNDVTDADKYWHNEFEKLYGYNGREYNLKITLMLIKQYYECAIIKEKCRVAYERRVTKDVAYDDCSNDIRRGV